MNQRNPSIPMPQNVHDLRRLLNQYGGMLSPQNRSLITEVIQNLESGTDAGGLQSLMGKVQRQAQVQQRQQQQQHQQPMQRQQQQAQRPMQRQQQQAQRTMPGQRQGPQGQQGQQQRWR